MASKQASQQSTLAKTGEVEAVEVSATKQWIEEIIIGLNFCPFAKKEFVNNSIRYHRSTDTQLKSALQEVIDECHLLEQNQHIETTLVVYVDGFKSFDRYLDLVDYANELLIDSGFEGIFQMATMHPEYCFADVDYDDASNYTNRSPYPMLHIIRETSMSKVLSVYKDPESIPENNMRLADEKGGEYFREVLTNIHKIHEQK